MTPLWIAAGGALGAVARYGLGGWVQKITGSDLPWGTAAVNVSGSLFLGFLVIWLRASIASADARSFVTIGVLGGFTTFSTLSFETVAMLQQGEWGRAAGYALGSLALGVVAVVLGMAAAEALLRRTG